MEWVRLMCTQKKTKDSVEKESKKKLYVLERELVCTNEEETNRYCTYDIACCRATGDFRRQNNK